MGMGSTVRGNQGGVPGGSTVSSRNSGGDPESSTVSSEMDPGVEGRDGVGKNFPSGERLKVVMSNGGLSCLGTVVMSEVSFLGTVEVSEMSFLGTVGVSVVSFFFSAQHP
jgi:hypothetical protein